MRPPNPPDRPDSAAPEPARELVEGVHYTVEAGRWVFTERFHRERGYCCENGCRHCPYGFRKAEA